MEDASVCLDRLDVAEYIHSPLAFFGIFDGHGGTAAAQYVSAHLVATITADPAFAADPGAAMVRTRHHPSPTFDPSIRLLDSSASRSTFK
jgi:hypothetical protein